MSETVTTVVNWDADARAVVEQAWGGIMKVAETVVKKHEEFGFSLIATKINPSLDDILRSLRVIEGIIDLLLPDMEEDFSLARMVLNAKQQIVRIGQVSVALKTDNQDDYDAAIRELKAQAPF